MRDVSCELSDALLLLHLVFIIFRPDSLRSYLKSPRKSVEEYTPARSSTNRTPPPVDLVGIGGKLYKEGETLQKRLLLVQPFAAVFF